MTTRFTDPIGEPRDRRRGERTGIRMLVFGAGGGISTHEAAEMVSTAESLELVEIDNVVTIGADDAATVQLEGRHQVGAISARLWQRSSTARRRALLHNLVTQLSPGALVLIGGASTTPGTWDHVVACGLEPSASAPPGVFRRTSRTTVHDLVAQARAGLVRLGPAQLADRMRGDDGCLVLDTRTRDDRDRFGTIPGSRHVPRSTLEWRVDPASGYSEQGVADFDRCLVVVCNDGYSSSLAAASLQRLGFAHATDLRGGFRAWRAAGMPVTGPPRHHGSAPATT